MNKCETCLYERESCEATRQEYGEVDEVIKCDAYLAVETPAPTEKPLAEEGKQPEVITQNLEKMRVINENCSVCNSQLKEIPVNSRIRAIVCDNARCSLFRERIRTYSVPLSLRERIVPEGMYFCTYCMRDHRETSKIGKKHLRED